MRFVSYGAFNGMVYANVGQWLGGTIELQIGLAFLGVVEAAIAAENRDSPLLKGRCFLPVLCLHSKVQRIIDSAKRSWERRLRDFLVCAILWSASLVMGTHLILGWFGQ